MRNYIRYVILLVLIIIGGLLIISIVNKVSEPKVSKVNNKPQSGEVTVDNNEPTLDISGSNDNQSDGNDNSISDSNTSASNGEITNPVDSVSVPNTKANQSIVLSILGFGILVFTLGIIRKETKNN